MEKVLMSSEKDNGMKYSESRTMKKKRFLQHSRGKYETVFTFGEKKKKSKK